MYTKQLIVNADDFGHTDGLSRGILQAHREGIVTSTSVMAGERGCAEAIRAVQATAPELGLGLHLAMTGRGGRPLLDPAQVPSLVQADGTFYPLAERLARFRELAVDEVAREFRAQWDWFVAAAGRAPDHLDAHHHIAYRHPGALAVLLDLAEEHGVPVRGVGADAASREELVADLPPETRAEASAALREVWERQRAPLRPAHFIASFYGAGATLAHLRELLAGLPAGVSELMCHPGYVDADLQSDYTATREVELRILTDPRVREQVVAEGIELIAFGALR